MGSGAVSEPAEESSGNGTDRAEQRSRERAGALALRVLEAARNQLFFAHRFLEQALFRLKWKAAGSITFGSDGEYFCYDEEYILRQYMQDPGQAAKGYLHTVMHCLYQHPFLAPSQRVYWDLAADIAAESLLQEAAREEEVQGAELLRRKVVGALEAELGAMSAKKIYRYLEEHVCGEWRFYGMDFSELCSLFRRDDHEMWYSAESGPQGEPEAGGEGKASGALEQIWKHAAGQVMMELQAFSGPEEGNRAGAMIRTLGTVTRENYDYSVFLRKFALRTEERMRIDQDEFDIIFYTYGLKLFKRVPLIEPLEYKEARVVREFVIAIDTSGSCAGELVERFLVKTCNILRQTETFSLKVNIHIIQCDAEVQEDVKIESQKQLEEYIACLELKGFGGTDFRPVFAYVDSLLESGELGRVEGLLYFTDGYGIFPARPPWYRTAFVFLDRAEDVKVPPWAMKVYLEETDL